MKTPTVGILGMGYLGMHLCSYLTTFENSWGTYFTKVPENLPPTVQPICFHWEDQTTWAALPEYETTTVLTIPPVLKMHRDERKRLEEWAKWMNEHRPLMRKLIYISSTGVYPLETGIWHENTEVLPDSPSGKLRRETEKVLENYFDLWVIRPGGIYGPHRHLAQRLLNNQLIPQSQKPIHRIHVSDLAALVVHLIEQEPSIRCVNAVDMEAKASSQVIFWLLEENLVSLPKDKEAQISKTCSKKSMKAESADQRWVSNDCLLKELKFELQFPTFREGLRDILS